VKLYGKYGKETETEAEARGGVEWVLEWIKMTKGDEKIAKRKMDTI